MAFVKGVVEIFFGGMLSSRPTDVGVNYIGGSKELVTLDEDEASYQEIKHFLREKDYNEYCYRVYLKLPSGELIRLYSDESSRRFGKLIRELGTVVVYVEHGVAINREFVAFGKEQLEPVIELKAVVTNNLKSDKSKNIKRTTVMEGKAVVTDNEVNLADNEDGTWDLYGYMYGYGNAGPKVVEEETNPEVAEGVDADSDIDDRHEDELSDGFDNLSHEDSEDDEELKAARRKLRASAKVSKLNEIDGLLEALKAIHGASIDLRSNHNSSTFRSRGFNVEDDVGSEDSYETDVEEDDEGEKDVERANRRRQGRYNFFDPTNKVPVFKVGMYFSGGHVQFRRAVDDYAIFTHRHIVFKKNDKTRVRAICVDKCPWLIYGSYNEAGDFQIKTFNDIHTCTVVKANKRLGSVWLAEKFRKHFRAMPNLRPSQLQSLCQEELGVYAKIDLCRTARRLAMDELYGEIVNQYKRLWDYVEQLKVSNPGSTVDLVVDVNDKGEHIFRRLYVCFSALSSGFLEGCRKVIGVDGCFLKGVVRGELLVAVGRDANNQMFVIAWAQVEVEDTDTWTWFLSHLVADLGILNQGDGWAILSDRQKGLLAAIADILPYAEHRACARHLFCKWRKTYRGKEFAKLFWRCAKSPNMEQFNRVLHELEKKSAAAVTAIMDVHPQHWCRAYFTDMIKSDIIDNNLCEAYNGSIVTYRNLPIIDFFERMRIMAMQRVQVNYAATQKWDTEVGPRIKKILEMNKLLATSCAVVDNGAGEFEVTQGNHKHVVKVFNQECSCRSWSVSGIPCMHACGAIFQLDDNHEKYVHPLLQRSSNLKAYQYRLPGVVGRLECPNIGKPDVHPPPDRKMPGRPPVKRKRDAFEGTGDHKLPKIGQVKRCKNCRQTGHNISTCPELGLGKVAAAPKEKSSRNNRAAIIGMGLYVDPFNGQQTMHPGTSSEHIIAPPRKTNGSSSSRAPQVKSTSQRTLPSQTTQPTRTSNKVTSSTQHTQTTQPTRTSNKVTSTTQCTQPSKTTNPTRTSNKVTSTTQPTPSSPRLTTRNLSQGKESTHLAPPPLSLGHSGFKRSGVLSIPGRKDWVTASQLKKVVDDKRKGKEKVATVKAKTGKTPIWK